MGDIPGNSQYGSEHSNLLRTPQIPTSRFVGRNFHPTWINSCSPARSTHSSLMEEQSGNRAEASRDNIKKQKKPHVSLINTNQLIPATSFPNHGNVFYFFHQFPSQRLPLTFLCFPSSCNEPTLIPTTLRENEVRPLPGCLYLDIPEAQSRLLIFRGNSLPRQMDLRQFHRE